MRRRGLSVPRWLSPTVSTLLLIVLFTSAPPAAARVFSRWRAGTAIDDWMDRATGRLLHATAVTLNGAPGDLSVYGLNEDLGSVVTQLKASLTDAAITWQGGALALGEARDGRHVLRLVITQPDALGPTVVFAVRQSLSAFTESQRPPSGPPSDAMPDYPGAAGRFAARTAARGADFYVAQCADAAGEVRAFCDRHLRASGWAPAMPGNGANPTSLGVFLRDGETMLVLALRDPETSLTTITLLHKRQTLK
jgi:hypothetical protein